MNVVRRFRVATLAGAMTLVAAAAAVRAHEPGTTRVDFEVGADGTVTIAVPMDPLALWRLRELDAGRVPDASPSPAALRAQGDVYAEVVQRAIDLRVDGSPVLLQLVASDWVDESIVGERRPLNVERRSPLAPGSGTAPSVLVTFKGHIPPGTRTVTWRYGLPLGAYPLRVLQPGRAAPRVHWIVGGDTSTPVPLTPVGLTTLARQYVWLGLVHIVPRGIDHILFVLSLFLLAPHWRSLLAQVSAFTVAHTVTLGATMVGWISLPSLVVEPLIAASIAWVAIENVWRPTLSRTRVAVVFLFGLLHGAGFAGVLTELGLPASARVLALLAFNLGVEAGQALVLLAAFACTAALLRRPRTYRTCVVVPASLVIAAIGLYWTVERMLSLQAG